MAGTRKAPINTSSSSRPTSVSRELKDKATKVNGDKLTTDSPSLRPTPPGPPKIHKRKSSRLLDTLFHSIFIFLVIYLVAVCPTDNGQDHQVCRAAREYRRRILDPLVIRPAQAVLSHPAVTPIVARVEPQLHRAMKTAAPILSRAQTEWKYRVSSQWNKRVMPQWRRHVLPHIHNLDKSTYPYRARVAREYTRRIAPFLKVGKRYLRRFDRRARKLVRTLAHRSREGYQAVKPFASTGLRHGESYLRGALLILRAQRIRFVDPHVAKIWDKVKELSSGSPTSPTTNPDLTILSATTATDRPTSFEATVQMEVEPPTSPHSPVSIVQTPTPTEEPSVHVMNSSPPSEQATPVVDETAVASTPTLHRTAESSVARVEASTTLETLKSVSSVISETLHDTPTDVPAIASLREEIQSSVVSAGAAAVVTPKEVVNGDPSLDDFFADLGLNDFPQKLNPHVDAAAADPEVPESGEGEAEMLRLKLEETARKRAEITARHLKWETELEAMVENKLVELRKGLTAIRKAAALEVKESEQMKKHVEHLDQEGEKFLRGAETYLQQLLKEEKSDDDKSWSWSLVISRIEDKFTEKTKQIEEAVNEWSRGIIQREHEEVRQAQTAVKNIAENAQADLGLDYAWLDDVTYLDWQRYHDLTRKSERFADEALSIQNGSHPVVPGNPVLAALNDLSSELEDLILGFQTRLRRIKRTAARTFSDISQDGVTLDEDETPRQPEISLSPVPGHSHEETAQGVPPIFLGRDDMEIQQALERSSHDAAAKSSEEELNDECESTEADSVISKDGHTEL